MWAPDWQDRVRHVVRNMGYSDVFDYVLDHPSQSFGELFGKIRESMRDRHVLIAFAQFPQVYYCDAASRGRLRDAFVEAMARAIHQHFKSGWGKIKNFRDRYYAARSAWPQPYVVEKEIDWLRLQEAAWEHLVARKKPVEWCPKNWRDAILQETMEAVWPSKADLRQLAEIFPRWHRHM